MNTTDVLYNGEIKNFSDLFSMARDQFVQYELIEGVDWDKYDFSIDCSCDQLKFKDMLQIRFIEELTEASESEEDEHFWEEIGDSINFFLSAYTMLGIDLNKLITPDVWLGDGVKYVPTRHDFSIGAYEVIESVGYLCNLLKNRPWAQSNYLVSMYDFDIRLNSLWEKFWTFLGNMGVDKEDVFEMFYKKYMVNQHRMETGY